MTASVTPKESAVFGNRDTASPVDWVGSSFCLGQPMTHRTLAPQERALADTFDTRLRHLLNRREDMRLEFKEARTELPATLFETICAMLNRDGGDILLGVDDRGAVAGVAPERVDVLKANLVNLSNNPQKLDPPFILFASAHDIDGKIILHVSVPASSQVHRSAAVVFDRANDGDFRVTQPHRIAEISNRKRRIYTEDEVYPYARMKDFRLDLLPECRNLMLTRDPDHPWLKLTDQQLLLKAGLRTPG